MMSGQFAGRKILLVEDEYYQALETEAMLRKAGATVVGPTAFESDVLDLLSRAPVDAALIDINLGQGATFEIAKALQKQGIPFVFLTGYDKAAIPAEMQAITVLKKPAKEFEVLACLSELMSTVP
jgi:DNA-binding LytR/AlgR family response regulator